MKHGVFHEHELADEKITEIAAGFHILVATLLVRQFDMQAHGLAPGLEGSLVGRFHDAGAAAGDDAEARVHQHAGDFFGVLVFLHVRRAAGRTENGNAVDLQGVELVQRMHHFPP